MENVFTSSHPLVQHKLTKLRDQETNPKKFRELIREIAAILRAGLGMVEGVWELMPSAEVWHIGLYRDEETLQPVQYYNKLPVEPTVSVCLILDPMLATGGSASPSSGKSPPRRRPGGSGTRGPPPLTVRGCGS